MLRFYSVAITLLGAIVLARLMGPDAYGVYAHVLSVAVLLGLPAQVGLPTLMIREVAKLRAIEDWPPARGLMVRANQFVVASSLIVIIVALVGLLFARNGELLSATMLIGLATIPVTALANIRGGILQGLGKVVTGQLPEYALRPTFVLLFVWAASFSGQVTSLIGIAAFAAAVVISFLVGQLLLARALPNHVRRGPARYHNVEWARAVLPLGLLAGSQVLISHTDIVMLGFWVSSPEVANYRIAMQGAMLVALPLTAISTAMAPRLAAAFAHDDRSEVQGIATTSARLAVSASLVIGLGYFVIGSELIKLAFGVEYQGATVPLMLLSAGYAVFACFGSVLTIANMAGYERLALRCCLMGAVINVALNIVLIPRWGVMGAATASVIATIVWKGVLVSEVAKTTGIWSHPFHVNR